MDLIKLTKITKLRDFQYRLLLNKLVTGVHLKKWGKKEDDTCSFCKSDVETVLHVLTLCPISKLIFNVILKKVGVNIEHVTCDAIMYNKLENDVRALPNLLCIWIKQYLYRKICEQKMPNVNEIIAEIDNYQECEWFSTKLNNKCTKHIKLWVKYKHELSEYIEENNIENAL